MKSTQALNAFADACAQMHADSLQMTQKELVHAAKVWAARLFLVERLRRGENLQELVAMFGSDWPELDDAILEIAEGVL